MLADTPTMRGVVRILVLVAAMAALAGCGSGSDGGDGSATPTAPTTLSTGALQASSCANAAMSKQTGQGRVDDSDSGCPAVRVGADGTCTLVGADPPVSAPSCGELFARLAEQKR
jgi:hypothetical protein